MSIEFWRHNLRDKVTVWHVSPDGYGGFVFQSPVLANGHWMDQTQIVTGAKGEEIVSKGWTLLDTDVNENDYVCLGDQTSNVTPEGVTDAWPVIKFEKRSDLLSACYHRRVYF